MLTQEALEQLNRKKARRWLLYAVGWFPAIIIAALVPVIKIPLTILVIIGGPILVWIIFIKDKNANRLTLSYDPSLAEDANYLKLMEAFAGVAKSQKIHEQTSSKNITQQESKRNAGAGSLVSRKSAGAVVGNVIGFLSKIHLNIKVFGFQTSPPLYFLPDCMITRISGQWLRLEYSDVQIKARTQDFIEDGFFIPKDAPVVGQTWKYVNKSGGPDKRMKDNKQIPVLRYDFLEISVGNKYQESIYCSAPGCAEPFAQALLAYKQATQL
ncbi:MAG: hypothetical protein IPM61_11655 [Chlorobi bacterium]|nr:MAG: hypothetical protein UZ07_CHB004001104 [Chlorobi bacterium OLB7]MBK8911970.1 hypothetical protein [Chlorobiota bacterium]MBX7215391.1 hypothetical protein [Candidatus Kapabacteria bacterium]